MQLVTRYEELEKTRGAAGSDTTISSAGVTYFESGHDRKIQFDYSARREELTGLENGELRLSVIAVF